MKTNQINPGKLDKKGFSFFMISLLIILLAGSFLSCMVDKSQQKDTTETAVDFEQFISEFKNPSASCAPAPLFVWNERVTKDELKVQLADLKDKGFGGVFVHPRPGMVNEYLSDNWFDLFDFTLEQCKKLGMEVWIYDENSYPSGFAGGYVPEQMPSSFNEGQGVKGKLVDVLPEDLSPFFIILEKEGEEWKDISANAADSKNKKAQFYLFEKTYYQNSPWFGGFTYVDLLKPGVTEKFIDVTFTEGYEKHYPEMLGKEIKGTFSDEPGIYAPDNQSIRWTPDLFPFFEKKNGYDLRTKLPSIYEETGDWKKVRYDYYKTLLELFIERWSKPMYEYCESKGLQWTGHYWEHEWPDPYQGPDNMAMYAWHQVPAIDMLFNDFNETQYNRLTPNHWPQAQFGNARAVKELASAANQLGKKRSLSETYGGSGWDFRFEDMKRMGDWEYVLGVNFMCQHLVDMSIKGARKYDYPQSFSYHEPWWDDYKNMNDYFARLSFALSSGRQKNPVLVIEPTTTTWMYAARGKVMDRIVEIGKNFHAFIHELEKNQVEYDLGSEQIISDHGSVEDGQFVVGECAYQVVVIPPDCETLDANTVELLKKYIKTGGKVIDLGSLAYINGENRSEEYNQLSQSANWMKASTINEKNVLKELLFDYWQVTEHDQSQGKLYHQRRQYADGQLLFFVNSDLQTNTSGIVKLKGKSVVELDPFTGDFKGYPSTEVGEGEISLSIDLSPAGSLLLYVLDEKGKDIDIQTMPENFTEVEPTSSLQIQPSEKNVLTLDFCDLKLNGKSYTDLHVRDASKRVFQAHGFEAGNPWNTSVQFRSETLKRDTFPEGSGFTAIYSFPIEKDADYAAFEAVIEGYDPVPNVKVNGVQVEHVPGRWWVDHSFMVYSIGQNLKAGMNKIEVSYNPMSVMAELEPVYILGDFKLKSISKGYEIKKPQSLSLGSWKEQGWPFYPKSVDYIQNFKIEDTGSYQVKLTDWKGTVAEVWVNDKKAGIIFGKPSILDISNLISQGENNIKVRVIGSNKNLFGPFHGNIPVGLASPSQWDNIHNYPAGNQYQQIDYGLFKAFVLERADN